MFRCLIAIASVSALSSVAAANDNLVTPAIARLLDQESSTPGSTTTPVSDDGADPIDRLLAEAAVRFASFADGADEHRAELKGKVESALQVMRDYIAGHPPVVSQEKKPTSGGPGSSEQDSHGPTAEPTANASTVVADGGSIPAPTRVGVLIPRTTDAIVTSPVGAVSNDEADRTSAPASSGGIERWNLVEHSQRLRSLGEELIELSERLVRRRLPDKPRSSGTEAPSSRGGDIRP